MQKTKVLVAMPMYHGIGNEVFLNRLAMFHEYWRRQDGPTVRPYGLGPRMGIRQARDMAINEAIRIRASHLLFLDDDILTAPTIIQDLLSVDKDIIGGIVKRDDGAPIVFKKDGDGEVPWFYHPTDAPFRCRAIGASCMMIKREVLADFNAAGPRWLFNYDDTERTMDVLFCRMAGALGFEVWAHPLAPCTQIKHYA